MSQSERIPGAITVHRSDHATRSRFKRRTTHVVELMARQDSVTTVYPVDLTASRGAARLAGIHPRATGIACAYAAGQSARVRRTRSIGKTVTYNVDYWLELWKAGAPAVGTRARCDTRGYGIYALLTCL